MNHVQDAVVVLTGFCGTLSGAIWGTSLEREEHEVARLYGRCMGFCYLLCFLVIAFS
jgi:hypothetical protein